MNHTIFLPFLDQDAVPLNLPSICQNLEDALDHILADVAHDRERHGITVSSSDVANQEELWAAVEPVLPDGVFGEPRW